MAAKSSYLLDRTDLQGIVHCLMCISIYCTDDDHVQVADAVWDLMNRNFTEAKLRSVRISLKRIAPDPVDAINIIASEVVPHE